MKISRRRYERELTAIACKAFENGKKIGQQEFSDSICTGLGHLRAKHADGDPIRHNAILHAQAFTEAHRLFAYAYDETSIEDAKAFQERFYRSRHQQYILPSLAGAAND